jgi:uncharacterized protein (DUF305 family)
VRHPDDNDADAEGDVEPPEPPEPSPGLTWPQAIALGAALMFLGFAIAVFFGRDKPPGEGSVDVGFLQDMGSHHDQALDMALIELANGSDPTVRSFASEVLLFQSRQLGTMERILAEWGFSRDDRPDEAMTWMEGMDPVPVEQMPGMPTDEQVEELRDAQGRDADVLFLELMAEHHRGGLHMAEQAADRAGEDDVRDLAARVGRTQALEINEYSLTAERLGLPVEIQRTPVPDAP